VSLYRRAETQLKRHLKVRKVSAIRVIAYMLF
jgi:hypothetical protein